MKPIVIFGAGDIAELAHFYFTGDGRRTVTAFTVDARFLKEETFRGLPVVAYEEASRRYGPASHDLFVALSYAGLNQPRKEKYLAARAAGYSLASYVSPRATVLTEHPIGDNCFVLEDNTIQYGARIGNNVTLWSGNHIGHHSNIGDHTFVASHAVISGGVTIGESCFIGVNATLRDHITLGERCVVGAGALLLDDAEAGGVYIGPATERSRVPSSRLRRI
jgi:sugar O-acyltransferase (sialic acid O-acetyltransferase NeuD family)